MAVLNDLLALLPDNTNGDIGANDLRSVTTDLWQQPLPYVSLVGLGPLTLPASASYRSLPTPAITSITMPRTEAVLIMLSVFIDSAVNNNVVTIDLAFSGATPIAAGARPETTLQVGSKTPMDATMSMSYVEVLNVGSTVIEMMYKASLANGIVSNAMLTMVTLGR